MSIVKGRYLDTIFSTVIGEIFVYNIVYCYRGDICVHYILSIVIGEIFVLLYVNIFVQYCLLLYVRYFCTISSNIMLYEIYSFCDRGDICVQHFLRAVHGLHFYCGTRSSRKNVPCQKPWLRPVSRVGF